jgi:hypothetical protein
MAKRIKEEQYYPVVEKWLKKQCNCWATGINKGLRHSRIDIFGAKDVGGHLSGEIDTYSVEVKINKQHFATSCGQASGYRIYANRIYLAIPTDEKFTDDEIAIAEHLQIGLIQISSRNVCSEILRSPKHEPIHNMHLQLLENLAIGQCQMCGSHFRLGNEESKRSMVARSNLRKAYEQEKGLIYWNMELADRKRKKSAAQDDMSYERRYICSDCVWIIGKAYDEA